MHNILYRNIPKVAHTMVSDLIPLASSTTVDPDDLVDSLVKEIKEAMGDR